MRARGRGGSAAAPALQRRHTKPTALELLPRPTEVQPRVYTCIRMYMHGMAMDRPTGAGNGRAAPAAARAAREAWPSPRAAPERKPGSGTGPGLVPDTDPGTGLNTKSHPQAPRSNCICTCTCLLLLLFLTGYVSARFRGDEGTCFSLVKTSCDMCLQK